MTKTYRIFFTFLVASVLCLSFGTAVFAQNPPQIQTISATSIQNSSANLNAEITYMGDYGSTTVYFQWGTTTSYGSQTPVMTQSYIGNFSQTVYNLNQYTTYHFRAVAQNSYGTVYGQDMIFTTGQSNSNALTANAGPDLYLTAGQTATLQGSGYSQNGYALIYSWSCNGGTLSSYNTAQPIYTAPYAINGSNQTTYTCTLTVTDNYGNSNTDSAIIYLNYNNNNNNNGSGYVQTNYATYVSNYQATLNGTLSNYNYNGNYSTNYVYFQYGTTTSYGSQTPQQSIGYSGTFMQNIENLNPGATYHFQAVAQGSYGTVYGQDVTFTTTGSGNGNNYYGSGSLSITKQTINLTSGNLNWSASVNAKPSDILSFAITLQANSQDAQNVMVRDILPSDLIYKGNLTLNNSVSGGDITSGVNIGTISAGQTTILAYQVQVAPAVNFSLGSTTLNNNATVTSSGSGAQTASATVVVNKVLVYGAATGPSSVSTGLTNNFWADSFFLPLLLIILGLWFYFSGKAIKFADWLKTRLHK